MIKEYENIVGYLDKKFEWFKIPTDYDDETQMDDVYLKKQISTQSERAALLGSELSNKEEISNKIKKLPIRRLNPIGEKIKAKNKWCACVFGECGQGKSTVLNEICKIVGKIYLK